MSTKNKPSITLSINPTYFCNFDCNFCYLTKEELSDRKTISLSTLRERIAEIEKFFNIDCVDLYGGEIALLEESYLNQIADLFDLESVDFNAITNLSKVNPFFKRKDISLSVSWEGNVRRKSQEVLKNMEDIGRDINLLMLAGVEVVNWSLNEIKSVFSNISRLENIKSLEIKPYSFNQANHYKIKFSEYEDFVKKVFEIDKDYIFVNEENLKGVSSGITNSFSDDHIYITPDGSLAVLDFDELDRELFLKIDKIEEYIEWSNNEKLKVGENSFCNDCEYLGRCLSEHLRVVTSREDSCNGFYNLIKWHERL